jgi:carbonic anhydrase/acetyltransferase-like protein (isoleucine patch superfamily)
MIIDLNGKRPVIGRGVYVAPTAVIAGDVTIGEKANIWFGAVIRADEGRISIGPRTSVQDNVVIHVNANFDTIVEADVTIGHGVVMEGCHIEAGALIGMNATRFDSAFTKKSNYRDFSAVMHDFIRCGSRISVPFHLFPVRNPGRNGEAPLW